MKRWQIEDRDQRWFRMNRDGMSQREIAEQENTTQSYVNTRIKKYRASRTNERAHTQAQLVLVKSTLVKDEYRKVNDIFERITEDKYDNPRDMQWDICQAVINMGPGMHENMDRPERNAHGDFVKSAFERYAAFAKKFNDFGTRISE